VTGNDLANLIRKRYNRNLSFSLWIMTEVAIIGADI
jgi:Mn2+/Fe2+ NRAMP family transporter